ncbi:LAME_0G19966g1_1 [Lachancea meyersii CBS 8951]|uniref:LAME_0G19966g1_1 n=1 Tax=Lachancea meyersii CBS 8951 TaxID=1266667 RepID=A0A1G4KC97_9SACH|nr:LAME_0G19966g1_1 [Lachancea meyersii CBS 8951]
MSSNPASFQSILAGVQKLREAHNANDGNSTDPEPALEPRQPKSPPKPARNGSREQPVVNSFNQQKNGEDAMHQMSQVEERKRKWAKVSPSPTSVATGQGKNVLVSVSQRGNPLLSSMTNTSWRYVSPSGGNKIYYDYCVQGRNIVFLSLKYHKLHPEYISKKIQPLVKLKNNVLICVVDVDNSENILKDLNKACMFNGFALLLAFSFEQAAKYIVFMNK